MSIVLASRLSSSDLSRLGNNLTGPRGVFPRKPARRRRLVLAGVNRSLAVVGERIGRLYGPAALLAAAG